MRYAPKRVSSMNGARFNDDIHLIYYQLQLITKNMPWINKIYLLLSNKEQIIPQLLPKNCEIVLHKDFIPYKYLPTFNSCTIEMFLWNIPNLSEYFIYANDDMLPIKPLKPSDFFYENRIRMNFHKEIWDKKSTEFKNQCYNSYHCMLDKVEPIRFGEFIYPYHSMTPMIKSHCEIAYNNAREYIEKTIRPFRTMYQCNQYIYPIYELLYYDCLESKIPFYYTQLDEENINIFMKNVENASIICPNMVANKMYLVELVKYLEILCK